MDIQAPNIAFIDDEVQITRALQRTLRKEPYQCFFYNSAAEFLADIGAHEFDVVVSDMRMPDMDGAELFKTLIERQHPAIKILLTGQADQQDTIKAINDGGIYRFLAKPWSDEELLQTLKEAVQLRISQKKRNKIQKLTSVQNKILKSSKETLTQKVEAQSAELEQTMGMYEEAYKETRVAVDQCVRLLSDSLNKRVSLYTGYNAEVAQFAGFMADFLKLETDRSKNLEYAALLNDIGKAEFSNEILQTSPELMSKPQRSEFQKHPELAQAMLTSVGYLQESANILLMHRERWDGRGFPHHLVGAQISEEAQVLSVSVDFITCVHQQQALGENAIPTVAEELKSRFGQFYAANFYEAFANAVKQYRQVSTVLGEEVLRLEHCSEDLVLTRDLLSKGGLTLVTKGTHLTNKLIERLKRVAELEEAIYLVHVHRLKKEETY